MSFSFHFVTWFLVVFGDQVTKILHNSLFTFFTEQGKTEHMEMKISQPIVGVLVDLRKNKLTKICNKPGKSFNSCLHAGYNSCS